MRKRIMATMLAAGVVLGAGSAASAANITEGSAHTVLVPPVTITRALPTCPKGRKVLKPEWQAMHCKMRRGQRLDVVLSHRTYLADQQATCDNMGGWLYRTPDGLWSVCVGVDY